MKSLILALTLLASFASEAARLKDIAKIRGVRGNQLVGYGVVVGLNGTGDSKSECLSIMRALSPDSALISAGGGKSGVAKTVTILSSFARLPSRLQRPAAWAI